MNKIKITVECYEKKYTIEVDDEITTDDMVQELKKLLYCIGYHSKSIESVFNEE